MGMAEFARRDSGKFSAPMGSREFKGDSFSPECATRSHTVSGEFSVPMGARKFAGDLLSPGCATGSHGVSEQFSAPMGAREFGAVRVAGGQHGINGVDHATDRFASGLGRHESGAATRSDVADSHGIETRLDRRGESSAGANVVARGRLANEPSLHVGSTALPSDSMNANADADRIEADRIADLQGDSMSSGTTSSDCARARNTAECRVAVGRIPDVVEQHTAAGDSCNLDTCEGFPLCDSVIAERPGVETPSANVEGGTASPSAVEFISLPVPGLYLRNDRLINDRTRFGRRTDSVLNDANDAKVKFDEFGYLYEDSNDNHTEDSANSCDSEEFGNFTLEPDGMSPELQAVENAPGGETENARGGLRRDCINLDSAVFDENSSQRPRRNLRRPAKYDDFSVNFPNSQYIRRIKKCTLPESSYSSSPCSDVLLTSRDSLGLTPRPLIGQHASSEPRSIDNVNFSESCRILSQLSSNFCGDNLANGKFANLDCCDSNGGIQYSGDRIVSLYDDITVVPSVPIGTSSALSFTNPVLDAQQLLMARVKQTARKYSEDRQPGVSKAVREYTCFVCGWTTEWVPNLRRHLARIHTLREDGAVAGPSYRDKYANKRSQKWQQEHAVAKDVNYEGNDVETCAPPVPKKPKMKNVRRVGQATETGLLGVGKTHTTPLPRKIGTVDKSANFSARDAPEVKGGLDPMLAQVTVPAHSATLRLPATDIETHAYENIEMLLNDELRAQEVTMAVQGLFDLGFSGPTFLDLSAIHDVTDIPLGLGWRYDMMDDICDSTGPAVAQADRAAKAGAKVDPVITKALKTKSARGATTPQHVVSSMLATLIDDVVYASPEALVGSILEDLVAKAVPRPLPNKNKKEVKRNEKKVDPGTLSGSATSAEVSSCAKSNEKKVATKKNDKKNNNVCNEDKVQSDDALVSVRFDKGPRVAHVPSNVVGDDPTMRKPCAPRNPAPRVKTKPHVAGTVDAISVSLEDATCANVSNENASSRRKAVTKSGKNADTKHAQQNVVNESMNAIQKCATVAHARGVMGMSVSKTPSKCVKVAHNVSTTPSKTSAMRADLSFLASAANTRVVQSPPMASRKYLPRKTVAKYAWKLDRSTADVAVMLKEAYGLTSNEQSRMVDRVSDMRCAFKHMTAHMREQCGIDVVTEADRVDLYHKLEGQLKFVEVYDDEDDA